MPVRVSESNWLGERVWLPVVHVLRCAAPPVCFSPILLLHSSKSGSAYCLLVVLSMWWLRLLPLPVATCVLSLLLFSLTGISTEDDEATHEFGIDSVLLIACFSLFVAVDSTSLFLRTALWLLGVSGARLRPLVFVFMMASFLGALVLPDFLVALVLSSVIEKAVSHLRCKFVSQQFRGSPGKSAAATKRSQSNHVALRKIASVMNDIYGRITCGAGWTARKGQVSTPDSQSPTPTLPQNSGEQPTSATTSVRPEQGRSASSPSPSSTTSARRSEEPHQQVTGGLRRQASPGPHSSPASSTSPVGKKRRNSCPASAQPGVQITERLSDPSYRRMEQASSSEVLQRRTYLGQGVYPRRSSLRSPSVTSPDRVPRGGGFGGRRSSVVFLADLGAEDRGSASVTAENLTRGRRRSLRHSSTPQLNFGDMTDSRMSARTLVPWKYSREDLAGSSSRTSVDHENLANEKMWFTIRKTFIIGVVTTSTLASACAKSTRALIAAGVPRYSFKVSALVVLPVALGTTLLCWTALFFAYLSEYDELARRSSALAIRDVMQEKLGSMGKVALQECFCFTICLVTTLTCAVILFTSKAELATCVALAAFALVFGLPGISGLTHARRGRPAALEHHPHPRRQPLALRLL
ncbi:hypothetical protein MTO96_021857 [Rhipicephalus appendiculatus]